MFETLRAYPRAFKVLVASALIENMAFGLIIPFLTIYMTADIGVSDAAAGVILIGFALSGIPGAIFGGMLADKIGRRRVLLISLGLMSITILMYFLAFDFYSLLVIALADSFVASLYMPAASAMIADVIPPEKRPQAYSTQRIAWNVGLVFGPAIGAAIVASASIRELFLFGAVILVSAFTMNFFFIPETKPEKTGEVVTFRRVAEVRKDRPFVLICVMSGIFWFYSTQFMASFPVYATRDLQMPDSYPGILWAINGAMIVLLQLWVTSKAVKLRRSLVLMVGQIVSSTGVGLLFYAKGLTEMIVFIVIMTIGELIYMSILSAIIADMSPEDKRGIYMGFSGFVQTLGMGMGMLVGMWLLGALGAQSAYLWAFFGIVGVSTSIGYIFFGRMVGPEKDHPSKFGVPASSVQSH
jgi:MFS family permease